MNFQRNSITVTSVVLHPTGPQNPAVAFELTAVQQNMGPVSIQSSAVHLVRVDGIHQNAHSTTIRFRLNIFSSPGGTAIVTATQGHTSLRLTVSVEAAITLPDRNTIPGAVARLLMSEARGPANGAYVAADTLRAMQWMRRVLENRLGNDPAQFAAPHATNVIDIIKAPNQFAGFSGYPNYSPQTRDRLQQMLDLANNDGDRRQAQYREFVRNAITVAQAATAIRDPCPTGLYGWRTQGSASPGGRFVQYQNLTGNTFYTLP